MKHQEDFLMYGLIEYYYKSNLGKRTYVNYAIFAWHAKRSLNNQPASENRTALLNNKQLAHYRFSSHNIYFDTFWEAPNGITNLGIYNNINDNLIKLDPLHPFNKPFLL